MKKFLAIAMLACSGSAFAIGWPANFEGVMLQGFYWDSYNGTNNTKWATLEAQADELSQSFKLIWVPNSAKAASNPGMGYDPVYWFTNHNTAFGTEAQLRSMIKTFKDKGTGIIADVVVNHRSGVSNWTDFPKETWNGKTYQLGPEHICSSDEVRNAPGQAKPTGAPDTGEDFDGSRDLDHTSTTVQDNIKAYTTCLLTDYGYTGFRYDMVKGFSGQYVGTYNRASKPTYSVGEYWDGNYDAVAAWIEATGKESAAFDFPFKYAVNEAFANNDMTKLVWKANGNNDQPAGMIHFGYAQLAVTFIDNHDTSRDDWNKFNGNVVAANAFMLCSPGTPCVFMPHWQSYKSELKAIIAVRNAVGVSNTSTVKVLKSERNCYMAEVYGSKGTLVVKIGSAMVSPQGYSDSDIKASGTDYCIWTKASVNGGGNQGGNTTVTTEAFKVYFDNSSSKWTTPHIHYWGAQESTWPGVAMSKVSGDIWSYTVPAGTTGLLFNAGDGDATKTSDFTATPNHIYTTAGDQGEYGNGGGNQGGGSTTVTTDPFKVYFNNSTSQWATPYIHYWGDQESTWPGVAMSKVSGDIWSYTVPAGTTGLLFNAGDGDATKTPDFPATPNHIYTTAGDQGVYSDGNQGGNQGGGGGTTVSMPSTLYIIGNLNELLYEWDPSVGVEMTKSGNTFMANNVDLVAPKGSEDHLAYFSLAVQLGADWDILNSADRFGATELDAMVTPGTPIEFMAYPEGVSASAALSWAIQEGKYNVSADFSTMKLTVQSVTSGVEAIDTDCTPAVYYNLQGLRVENPSAGIYIKVSGGKAMRVYVK